MPMGVVEGSINRLAHVFSRNPQTEDSNHANETTQSTVTSEANRGLTNRLFSEKGLRHVALAGSYVLGGEAVVFLAPLAGKVAAVGLALFLASHCVKSVYKNGLMSKEQACRVTVGFALCLAIPKIVGLAAGALSTGCYIFSLAIMAKLFSCEIIRLSTSDSIANSVERAMEGLDSIFRGSVSLLQPREA